MSRPTYIPPPRMLPNEASHRIALADSQIRMLQGRLNVTGNISIALSATTTTIVDPRINSISFLEFMPLTQSAATLKPSIYVLNRKIGAAEIGHDSGAGTENFDYLIIG